MPYLNALRSTLPSPHQLHVPFKISDFLFRSFSHCKRSRSDPLCYVSPENRLLLTAFFRTKMSGRGRGRGGGGGRGGRGPPRRDQPTPSPSRSYGRGGGGGGRGPTEPPSYQPPPAVLQPVVPATYSAPTTSSVASSSTSSLSREVETKLTLESPAQSVQRPEKAAQAVQQPVSQLPPASSKSYRFPSRPGYGKEGRKCIVRANHFLVTVADKDRHHYDVTINPEVTNKKVCRQIIKTLDDSFRLSHLGNNRLAYDGGKSIYTAGALPFSSKDFVVKLEGRDGGARRDREFRVSIKFASKPDLYHLQQFLAGKQLDAPHETIQLLDVVLRETPSTHYAVVGRSFFSPEFGCGEFGDGLDYWKGFYQSLRPTQMGLSLNINTSARAFYEPILISEFVGKYFNREPNRILSDQDRLKVKKALKGLRVEFRQQEYMRRYKVLSISTQPLSQLKFQDDTGRSISVVQYFRQKYNIPLRYANLPALNAGTDARPIYLPMEVCKIVEGQKFSKKLNSSQVTALLRAVCERPAKREASIKTIISRSNYNNDSIVKEFGIQVGAQFTSIEARVLDPPKLMYHATGKDSQVEPWVGQWNMINKKMVNGGTVEVWACVNFSRVRPDVANSFCHELLSMCCSKGMVFNQQPLLPIQSANPGGIEKALFDIHSQSAEKLKNTGKHLQMLIVILPDVSGSYGRIKRICETELGIVSQCCQPKQVMKCNKQYLENVSLKINVKVGGRNTVLASALARRIPFVSDRPTIIFGADVTHPQPGEDSSPSIAAVVASMDWPEVTKYRGLVSAQDRGEIIKDLYSLYEDPQRGLVHRGMIRELLIAFRKSTNQKPHRIIFYRDGVGEGQFNEVLLEEMDAIRKACQSLEENYLPPVTFVVVQKRHHTRLFPANHNDQKSTDKSGNILPGTVVDTSICHPTQFDFYLCSHAGIQGTSRPTHYHVLYDENNFSADALQSLTNNLCYTYARCTRSVSIVPPAYYAHLAAFRARYYMEGDMSETESTSGGRATREGNVVGHSLPAIKENVKDVMFYC